MLSVACLRSSFLSFLRCPTELMFNGCFHGLDKHQLLALVSCLVPCDKSNEEVRLNLKFQVIRTCSLACPLTAQDRTSQGSGGVYRTQPSGAGGFAGGWLTAEGRPAGWRAGEGLEYADGSLGWDSV